MVGETIGNARCQCIYPFDKHYLKLGIDELIKEQEEKIKKIQEGAEEIKKAGVAEPEALIDVHKRFKSDVETVKIRLENTPECK